MVQRWSRQPSRQRAARSCRTASLSTRRAASTKYQARILTDRYGKGIKKQEPVPGLYTTVELAEAAKTEAEQKLASGSPLAVWPQDAWPKRPDEVRNKRGEVRIIALLRFAHACLAEFADVCTSHAHRAQRGRRAAPLARNGTAVRRCRRRPR